MNILSPSITAPPATESLCYEKSLHKTRTKGILTKRIGSFTN